MRLPAFMRNPAHTTPKPDMPYSKVLARCVFPRRADEDPRLDAWAQCTTDLNQSIKELAGRSDLHVWGRYNGDGGLVAVPAGHWTGNVEIELAHVIRGRAISRSQTADEATPWYDDLTFDCAEVRRRLPSKWIGGFRVLSCGFIKP